MTQKEVTQPACHLSREVYCVLGLPIDAVDMPAVLRRINAAVAAGSTLLLATPNLNFVVNARTDQNFRESLLDSDLCPADGMPIVWIARLLGVPIRARVSGSDIFDALKAANRRDRPLRVFLFGGPDGVAETAARSLNDASSGLSCVGTLSPGFGTVEEMSGDDMIDVINASDADFLAVSLGAQKGQRWLQLNHQRLTVPVRAHLGAVINFEAGTIHRSPVLLQKWGLEWLWRIKEEPHLTARYWRDGWILLHLLLTSVLPLCLLDRWTVKRSPQELLIKTSKLPQSFSIELCGDATKPHVAKAITCFAATLTSEKKSVVIDLSDTRVIDQRFFGLLLMFRKLLQERDRNLRFTGMSPAIDRMFRLNQLSFLLAM